jgi:glycine/D-amino acid oxidase-like deaminating enzyme
MTPTEILIVGAGVVGSAAAYELASRGARVTLIEREHPAYGASGRNVGYLWTHTRSEGPQLELALAGRARYDELVGEIDDFEFRASGGMMYFFDHQRELFPAFVANRRKAGLPMELLDAAEARERCPILPEDIGGATWNPLDAHVHPERVVQSLVRAAEARGAKVVTGTGVTSVEVVGGRAVGVRTDEGAIAADVVLIAAGAWAPQLVEPLGLRLPIEAMRLQVIETEPIATRFDPILYGPTGVKQYALTKDLDGYDAELFTHPLEDALPGVELLELAAQRRDGRVLLGLSMDFVGLDDRTTVGGLGLSLGVLGDHLPALRDVAVERVWAGLLPQTPDALPVLDASPGIEGLAIAAGHVFGQMAGPISGKLIAQLLLGETPDIDMSPYVYERDAITGREDDAGAELRRW